MDITKSVFLTCIVFALSTLSTGASAQSGYSPHQMERIQVRYERLQQRNVRGRCGVVCQHRLNRLGGILSASSVPELDANTAPLAALLLGGMLAAGVERRRRRVSKS